MVTLRDYWFFGSSSDFVLIVAGIHNSEQSGIEVAHWLRVKLAQRPKPTRLGAIVIPEIFPDDAINARTAEWKTGGAGDFRDKVGDTKVFPARHFPPPGEPESTVAGGTLKGRTKKDLTGQMKQKQLANIAYLANYIERIKPLRIVSIHGKRPRNRNDLRKAAGIPIPKEKTLPRVISMTEDEILKWDERAQTPIAGVNFPGIYVDPRYDPSACAGFDLEGCKFDFALDPAFPLEGDASKKRFDSARDTARGRKDDALAVAAAKAVSDRGLVGGNHLGDPVPIVHYAKEGGTPEAFSLGDWGPVDVSPGTSSLGSRYGAPVFTIEVRDDNESWAFLDGVQVMDEGGHPLNSEPEPALRAVGTRGRPLTRPAKFKPDRSKQLQAYADAIIKTILELP
jgi:hypothetical protein